jgi:hypothetical protein
MPFQVIPNTEAVRAIMQKPSFAERADWLSGIFMNVVTVPLSPITSKAAKDIWNKQVCDIISKAILDNVPNVEETAFKTLSDWALQCTLESIVSCVLGNQEQCREEYKRKFFAMGVEVGWSDAHTVQKWDRMIGALENAASLQSESSMWTKMDIVNVGLSKAIPYFQQGLAAIDAGEDPFI